MSWILYYIRGAVYRLGFRPEPGSIFFSASRHFIRAYQDAGRMIPCPTPECNWQIFTSTRKNDKITCQGCGNDFKGLR